MSKKPVRYHVNPNTLRPNMCRRKKCPVLDREGNPVEHFSTREDALVHAGIWRAEVDKTSTIVDEVVDTPPVVTVRESPESLEVVETGDIVEEDLLDRYVPDDGPQEKCFVNDSGLLHREDGPAVIGHEGYEYWYKNGVLHREDGPAVVHAPSGAEWWYHRGSLHREDGPAIVRSNPTYNEYWFHGIQTTAQKLVELVKLSTSENFDKLSRSEKFYKVRELVEIVDGMFVEGVV